MNRLGIVRQWKVRGDSTYGKNMNYLSKRVLFLIVMLLMVCALPCIPKAAYADQHYDFTYPDRTSLIAAGWDFLAVTPSGGVRNTEQTSGAVVSYDQTAHPGVLRIPADAGDLWNDTNNSRNTLFRGLPSDWTSIRLKIAAWDPTQDYQQAGLLAYQDDDNYVEITRSFTNGNCLEFVNEALGSGSIDTLSIESTATDLYLRLDRDPSTNIITGSYSFTGDSWILVGSVTQALNSPQLAIFVGASPAGFPNADLQWAEVASGTAPAGAALSLYPGNLVFSSNEGTVNTSGQTVNVIYGSPSTTQWTQTSNAPWLITSPGSGSTAQGSPGSFSVSVDPTGLTPGVHTGTITVSSPDANNSPQTANVDLVVKQNPAVQVTTWKDGHPGAMSVWVDDGNSSCLTELQSAGFDGTYIANATLPDFYPSYYNAGMELGNHLFYHNCFVMDEYYMRYTEIEPNINEICANTPEPCQDVISLAWPCGFTTVEEEAVASDYYLSSRGYNFNLLEQTTPTDWMNLKNFNSHEHTPPPPADLKTVVDMAVQQGLWANLVFHTSCDDDNAIAYAATQDIWVAPAGAVVKYIWQRNAFILQSYQATSDATTFSYSRLGIPPSPFRSFETAFGPGDLITLQVLINGVTEISSVTLDGTSYPYTASTNNGNTIVLIDAPIDTTTRTIIVTAVSKFTVTASAGTGGSISPGTRTVNYNGTTTFTVTPNTGYGIASVTGCGGSLSGSTYTTGPITSACTVTAGFGYEVTPSAGSGGTISPATPQIVIINGTTSFTVTPNTGYHISSVTGCGGSLSGSTYTTGPITSACTVTAGFAINTYTVSATAGTGGSISPGTRTVNYNGTTTFTVTPASGYGIASVTGCGGSLSGNTYTTGPITSACTVTAGFGYKVTTLAGPGGTISPATPQIVIINGTTSFTVTPNTGYHIFSVTGCGGSLSGSTYTTGPITSNCTVTATLAFNSFTVSTSAGTGGSISPGTQTVNYNGTTTFTVTPNTGYSISSVTGCGGKLSGSTYTTGPITSACTVTAGFGSKVTPSAGSGGTISPATPQTVNINGTTSFTVTPNAGYHISSVTGCGGKLSGSTYTTGPITSACTVSAAFAINTFTVSATAGTGGTISPATQTVNYNGTTTFTVTPAAGYSISSVTGCGGKLSGSTYTTGPITSACTVTAGFGYKVTPSAGAGGTISPATPQMLNLNGTTSFTVTPNAGYHISSVTGCGGSLVGNTYTTGPVTSACTVSAAFAINTFTVSATAGTGGSISPGTRTVNYNGTTTFTVTPAAGYSISSVTGCGGSLVGSTYTTGPITSACTVTAGFGYKVTPSAGAGGTISPATPQMVNLNGTTSFTVTPNAGYHISSVTGCGGSLSGSTYTTGPVTSAGTVSAAFAINTFTVSATAGTGGSISPGTRTVNYNGTTTFTVTPAAGYSISSVTGCGGSLSGSTYTTGPITSNCTVTAGFGYKVTPSAGAGGTISPATPQMVNLNGTTSFTVTPNAGYHISSVTGCGGSLSGSTYTTGPVTSACTVTAGFAINTYTVSTSAGTGGSISPGTRTVNYNGTTTFTVTPAAGYSISSVTGCGGKLVGSTYTTGPITSACTVTAGFAISTNLKVTPSVGPGGAISPGTPQMVPPGSTTTFTVTPAAGYSISSVTGCGGKLSGSTYTTGPITSACTVSAAFAIKTYEIDAMVGAGGSILPSGTTMVNYGGSQTYTITPSPGYRISGVLVDGAFVGAVSSYTFSSVTANHAISATFGR